MRAIGMTPREYGGSMLEAVTKDQLTPD